MLQTLQLLIGGFGRVVRLPLGKTHFSGVVDEHCSSEFTKKLVSSELGLLGLKKKRGKLRSIAPDLTT
jgi:hypothetical protein